MIGRLPTTLTVDGKDYDIRTDYRDCLTVLTAFNDPELSDLEKIIITVKIIYINPPEDIQEAYEKAVWFLDCGKDLTLNDKSKPQLYDWEQDEQMMFSAINKVAGKEVRAEKYMHWWTFMGLFNEIGEGMFASVVNIRNKKARHKKLEKYEQEMYREYKDIIDLHTKKKQRSDEEKAALEKLLS